ncbi:MAG: Holliday junction branch migration protein RuvA [Bacteroidota bacterium]|nr:Holliday junction branch migration protein RuvA [Bacteroidota bacterium]
MISSLRGNLIYKKNNEIILDVNGAGYQIFVSKKVLEKLTEINAEYSVITHLDVKENSLQLYGFIDQKEKEIFKLLLSVSGIGPKIAHSILTHLSFEEVISIISNKSFASQMKIPGIGIKKLELISMTLKDKIYKIDKDIDFSRIEYSSIQSSEYIRYESLNALMNLGYQRNEAERIIREVIKQEEFSKLTTEEIIRKSLEYISK